VSHNTYRSNHKAPSTRNLAQRCPNLETSTLQNHFGINFMTAWLWVSKFAKASIPQFCWNMAIDAASPLQAELLMLMVGHPSSTCSMRRVPPDHDSRCGCKQPGAVDFTVQKLTSGPEERNWDGQHGKCIAGGIFKGINEFPIIYCVEKLLLPDNNCLCNHLSEGNEVFSLPKLPVNTEFFHCVQKGARVTHKRLPTHSNSCDFGWS